LDLQPWQWGFASAAALLIGISKTGLPGIAILIVPLLAAVFGGRASIGIMLPMLICGDFFAVFWYRRHAQWNTLVRLLPWVVGGLALGAGGLWIMGESRGQKDILSIIIGFLVLGMLGLQLMERRLGDRLTPRSGIGIAATGTAAGFATTVSNAAGPIMTIYLTAHRLPKEQFMGTIAWYFLIINLAKVPVYLALTALNPAKPIMTGQSVHFVLTICPAIIVGAFMGKWLLPRIPQKAFDAAVLALAAVSAVKLIIG